MERLSRIALDRPAATLLLIGLVTLAAAAGLPRLSTVVGYRGALSSDHPAILRLDRFIEDFGGGLPVAAVWSCENTAPCSSVFDEASLRMAHDVEAALAAHPLVRRIDSPARSALLVPSEEGFGVRRFFEDGELAADRESLAARALGDPLWRGSLVSPDGKVGAMVLQLTSSDSQTTVAVVPALQEALRPFEAQGFRFRLVGDPVDFAIAGGELEKETPRIIPIMVALIAATIYGLFRSWRLVAISLATTGLALVWALGAMGWLGWPQSEVTQALPPQILVIGICDTIHVLSVYANKRTGCTLDDVLDRSRALVQVAHEVGPPCLITALTTSLGFLSFSTTGFDLFARFGAIAALGVACALLLTFTLLPILLVRLPSRGMRAERTSDAWQQALHVVVEICRRRGRAIVVVCALLLALGLVGVSRLAVDVDERELFGSEREVVQWADFVEDRLRKTDTLEIKLTVPPGTTVADPLAMQALADLASHLPTLEGFGRVRSVLDAVGRLHRVLRDDDPAFERPAETTAANAQLLLALRLDEGGSLGDWLTPDQRQARVSVEVDSVAQQRRAEMLAAVRDYLDARLPEGWTYELTGPFAVYFDFVQEIQRSQGSSFGSAMLGVLCVFAIFLWWTGSRWSQAIRLAGLGMVPNVLPVVCTLGAMGLWGINLDVGTAMVAAIVLGIATDDTVHVISDFRYQLDGGAPPGDAMARTIRHLGRAIITTALALSAGFFALTLSSWQSVASFGLLSGIAILGALLAELFLLPALVMGWRGGRPAALRPGVTRGTARAGRSALTILAMVVTAGTLAQVAAHALRSGEARRLACPMLPNGLVPLAAAVETDCPLRPHEHVELLSGGGQSWRLAGQAALDAALASGADPLLARVTRQGTPVWIPLSVRVESEADRALALLLACLAALAALGAGLLVLWLSSAPAAAPLAALTTCLLVPAVHLLSRAPPAAGLGSQALAIGLACASGAHLVLSFPHPRQTLTSIPRIMHLLYLAGALNAALLVYGLLRYATLWRIAEWLDACAAVGLVAAFVATCLLARRDETALVRVRANAALSGLATMTVLLGLGAAVLPALGTNPGRWLMAGALLALPVPAGYAVLRHQLHDLRPHVPAFLVRMLLRGLYAGGLGAASFDLLRRTHGPRDISPAYSLLALCGLFLAASCAAEWLWSRLRQLLPSVNIRLRAIEADFANRIASLQSADAATDLAVEALASGLRTQGVSVFVPGDLCWRLAAARGPSAMLDAAVVGSSVPRLSSSPTLHFGIEEGAEGSWADGLRDMGVQILVPFRSRSELVAVGFVMHASDGLPYSLTEIAFVQAVAARAAVAIHNGRLAEGLLRAERYAAIGEVAAGLAHDLGKPMAVVLQRARSIGRSAEYPEELREHGRNIAALAEEALWAVDRLLGHGQESHEGATDPMPLESVVQRAVQTASRLHGPDRVSVRLAPGLPPVTAARDLTRAVVHLLDNALLASRASASPVEASACVRGDWIRIEILDFGCGMDEQTLASCGDPFFTTRSDEGGHGLGLPACRAIVEAMGGRLELASREGVGTQARIWLPVEGLS
jgi:hypothetical protein